MYIHDTKLKVYCQGKAIQSYDVCPMASISYILETVRITKK